MEQHKKVDKQGVNCRSTGVQRIRDTSSPDMLGTACADVADLMESALVLIGRSLPFVMALTEGLKGCVFDWA